MEKSSVQIAGSKHWTKICIVGLIAFGAILVQAPPALSMLPYYAQDWNTRFGVWSGSQFELDPALGEAARIIDDHAVVFAEGANRDGDATHFATLNPPPSLMYYLGYGGYWFEGALPWLDPNSHIKTREANFYHSTDPATLTGWRSGQYVHLHWTPDLRFVNDRAQLGFIGDPSGKPVVSSYVIVRTRGAVTDSVTKTVTIDADCLSDPLAFSYVDTLPGGGGSGPYRYSVRSIPPAGFTGGSRDFGTIDLDATAAIAEPHFWTVKPDYQERNYALAMGIASLNIRPSDSVAVDFPLRIHVDTSDYLAFNPAYVTLERATSYLPDESTYIATPYTIADGGLSYSVDPVTGIGAISCSIATSTSEFKATGGIAYRLHYYDPSTALDVYFPPERDTKKHFVWSSVNNRVMSATWFSYLMNCEGSAWSGTLAELCQKLGSGTATPRPGHTVTYDSVFLDSAMAITVAGTHNNVRPYEYDTAALCLSRNVATVKQLCSLGAVSVVANTPDLAFVDAFTSSGIADDNFAGVMDENVVFGNNGEQKLANMIWKFRGHPYQQNLVMNGAFDFAHPDYGVPNRKQAVAAYLLSRDPYPTLSNPVRSLFGYGGWTNGNAASETTLTILPEQMLNIGNVIGGDPFAATAWPNLASWQSTCGNNTAAANWLKSVPLLYRPCNGRDFAAMRFELEDGLPNEVTEVAVVWDITPDGSQGAFAMQSLFPEKADATWYALELDGTALLEGGVLSSSPVALNWPIPTITGAATLYFTKPVHSPVVSPAALRPIPAAAGRQGQLRIAASHWNGMPLAEVRVDGTLIGWGKDLLLTHAGDGVYTYTGSGTGTTPGERVEIPVVATGTDGLKTYTTVSVEAVEDIVIAPTAKYPLHATSHDSAVVFAVDILNFTTPTLVDVTFPPTFDVPSAVALLDNGDGAEDEIAGDEIFTSARVPATASVGVHSARVTVHLPGGGLVWKDVAFTVAASNAEFVDISQSTGAGAIRTGSIAQPYATATFETGKNGSPSQHAMIVTFDDAGTPPLLLERTSLAGEEPQFASRDLQWLGAGAHLPENSRGVTSDDYDNDNNNDVFLCNAAQSILYRNNGVGQSPQFESTTAAVFGSEASLINGALMASWGDFEGDGDPDLYVTTSDYSGPVGDIEAQAGVDYDVLVFKNDNLGHLSYLFSRYPSDSAACLSGVWAPLRGGTKLMMVSPWLFDGFMLAVHEPAASIYGETLITMPWSILFNGAPASLTQLNSITPFYYDGDALVDLVVTDTGGEGRAVILRNNWHWQVDPTMSYWAREFELIPLDEGRRWNGATVADFDGNRINDILLLPESGEPALFMASGQSTAPTYEDLGFTLGLRSGSASGVVAADLGGNNLPDLYLGRRGDGEFLYKNIGPTTQNWLDVVLQTVGNSSRALVGAEVVVSQGSQQWRQIVDGGSGRGGQSANTLRFYFGDNGGDVSVTVNYPSGDTESAASVPLGGTFVAIEDTPITLKVGTKNDPDPVFVTELGPGTMDWVFRWRTVGIKGDQKQDAVTIENYLGYTSEDECYQGIDPGTPLVLRAGDPGVAVRIYQDGAEWRHELRWAGLPCVTGCQYRFKVTSGIGNGVTSTGPTRVMSPNSFCLPDPDPQQ